MFEIAGGGANMCCCQVAQPVGQADHVKTYIKDPTDLNKSWSPELKCTLVDFPTQGATKCTKAAQLQFYSFDDIICSFLPLVKASVHATSS